MASVKQTDIAYLSPAQAAAFIARVHRDRQWYRRVADRLIAMKWTRDDDPQRAIEACLSIVHGLHSLDSEAGGGGRWPGENLKGFI